MESDEEDEPDTIIDQGEFASHQDPADISRSASEKMISSARDRNTFVQDWLDSLPMYWE